MNTLLHFKNFYEEIRSSNSRKHKQWVLERFKNDRVIQEYLKIAFNPYIVYGISYKKLYKFVGDSEIDNINSIFDLFDYLEVHNTGSARDISICQEILNNVAAHDRAAAALLEKLICKDISIGCDAKTINSVIPNLIPSFACMLANKYFDKPEKLTGKTFAITTKLDGFRLIAMKDEHGNVSFYSRVGKRIEGLVEIEEEMKAAFPECTVLDGELTVSNYFELESKEAYKAASKIISLKEDTPKRGLTYRVFDGMHIDEWRSQNCTHSYETRRNLLHGLFKFPTAPISHIELLPILYKGDDVSKVQELLDQIVAEGGEGVMINLLDSPYRFTRCWDIMKVKKFQSLDLEVIGVEEGSGRLAGTLGAILVRYKGGNTVRVGSGFSDEERALYWADPGLILHKVCEIKYFESTKNATGEESLRFPTWCSNIRDPRDKANPDF